MLTYNGAVQMACRPHLQGFASI